MDSQLFDFGREVNHGLIPVNRATGFARGAGHNVRVVLQGGEPWFVLKDVCDVLEVKTFHVKPRLEEDDLGSTDTIDRLGRSQTVTTVNESGLYDVILDSRKPEALSGR